MRQVSLLALVASSLSLAACAGGGGSGVLSSAYDLSSDLSVCGLQCDASGGTGGGGTGGGGTGGGGTGGGSTGGGSTGGGGSSTGGNTTNLTTATGARTIALENGQLVIPSTAGATSLSSLSTTNTTSVASNTVAVAAILSGTKPTALKIAVDTEGTGNTSWSVPILMDEYVNGSNATDQFNTIAANENMGSGSNYREYRALSASQSRDELLQVWSFDHSYALQYRNADGGGEAKQQAWSFGGNATTAMLTAGSGTYSGRFAATAKTENWLKPDSSSVDPNALWQVQGGTNLVANFGSGDVTGTLTPETWTSYQTDTGGYYTWYTSAYADPSGAPSVATAAEPYFAFYGAAIDIDASIAQTTGASPTNTAGFAGEANLDSGFVSGDNPVYGGFFGAGANEVAGVFNVYGTMPSPIGGDDGINDDRRGFLTINGAFQGNCVAGACTP